MTCLRRGSRRARRRCRSRRYGYRPETCTALRRLGFKTIGALIDKPRAPFAARFPAELLRRIDQALGRVDEPLVPVVAPPVYHSLRYLLEPIITQDAVVGAGAPADEHALCMCSPVTMSAHGGLRLSLYRVEGAVGDGRYRADLADAQRRACGAPYRPQARSAGSTQEAGFGFEAIGLAVTRAETMPARQKELPSRCRAKPTEPSGARP